MNKLKEIFTLFGAGAIGCFVIILLLALFFAISFGATYLILLGIFFCFNLGHLSLKLAAGIWLVTLLLEGIFKSSKSKSDSNDWE